MKLRELALTAGLALTTLTAKADPSRQEPLVFVGDPKFGVESTVRTFDSLERVVLRYDEVLPAITIDDSATFSGRMLRLLGRGVRLVFLDFPLADLASTVIHEVGGHGARARELALRPNYVFYLPAVYRQLFSADNGEAAGAYTTYLTNGNVETTRDVVGTLGGLEAQYTQAWWINARIVRAGGYVHHGDLLAYAVAKLSYARAFLSPKIARRGDGEVSGSDVDAYVTNLQELANEWRVEDRRRIAHRLTAGYLWNLADPTLLYSLYGGVVAPLISGERVTKMPLPRIGDVTVFPSPRYGVTPFGAEQALDVFLAQGSALLDLYGRVGTSGIATYWGAGARLLGLEFLHRYTFGAELDVWRQPELLLDGPRNVTLADVPNRTGVNAAVYGDLYLLGDVSLTYKLGTKTEGYVLGQPLAAGPYGYVGASLSWR